MHTILREDKAVDIVIVLPRVDNKLYYGKRRTVEECL